ncbi:purine-nucleoside phosphorylase [Murinocardiopsis flavida]|uniref:Purine nucleoside phosphorylase n=1 Tax=Murinocardiopsis flavida TaxID=645275 RepID=A0A2P8DIJ9_9ACTN|nr:purine-nucleoside phosphorylase [Murinocardiopsis flavida]
MSESTHDRPIEATAEASERASAAADELRSRTGADTYDAVVVLGSGWSAGADALGTPDAETDVAELPGFAPPTASGHSTKVTSLWAGSHRVAVFHGRTHLYEGRTAAEVVHAVRTGIAAGAKRVVLTSGAGSLRADFAVGQPVIVRDHINLTGTSPLVGPDFVDLTAAYSPRLREVAREAGPALAEGVYASVPGPQHLTPAELRMVRMSGADLVGTSVALETIAAARLEAEVLALALVTNDAVDPGRGPVNGDAMLGVVHDKASELGGLLHRILLRI